MLKSAIFECRKQQQYHTFPVWMSVGTRLVSGVYSIGELDVVVFGERVVFVLLWIEGWWTSSRLCGGLSTPDTNPVPTDIHTGKV